MHFFYTEWRSPKVLVTLLSRQPLKKQASQARPFSRTDLPGGYYVRHGCGGDTCILPHSLADSALDVLDADTASFGPFRESPFRP